MEQEGKLNMFPAFSSNYTVDVSVRNIEFSRYFSLIKSIFKEIPNIYNVGIRKFVHSIYCSVCMKCSSFFNHIFVVVKSCSKKEVIWVNARRVIAFMKNAEFVWNFPIMNFPGKSVCRNGLIGIVPSAPNRKLTMTKMEFVSFPYPACIGFFDFIKKSFDWISRFFTAPHSFHWFYFTLNNMSKNRRKM